MNKKQIGFDYSYIRKEGELLKTFGGVACGPKPLMCLLEDIRLILDRQTRDNPVRATNRTVESTTPPPGE